MALLSPSEGVLAFTGRPWNRSSPRTKHVALAARDARAVSASHDESGTILISFADQSTAPCAHCARQVCPRCWPILEVVLVQLGAVVHVQLVHVQQRIGVLQASSSGCCCLCAGGATRHRRTTCAALVDAIQAVGEGPAAVICLPGCHGKDSLLEVVPWRPRRPIMRLRQVLD